MAGCRLVPTTASAPIDAVGRGRIDIPAVTVWRGAGGLGKLTHAVENALGGGTKGSTSGSRGRRPGKRITSPQRRPHETDHPADRTARPPPRLCHREIPHSPQLG